MCSPQNQRHMVIEDCQSLANRTKTGRRQAAAKAAARGQDLPETGLLDDITLHGLRHNFAGIAEELGATIPTIAALLGHRLNGVKGGYILKRVSVLLVDTANRIGDHIDRVMSGEAPTGQIMQFQPRGRKTSEFKSASVVPKR